MEHDPGKNRIELDEGMISRLRENDDVAWEEIFGYIKAVIKNSAASKLPRGGDADLDDLIGVVLVKIVGAIGSYRHENFGGWVSTVTLNTVRDMYRKQGAHGDRTVHNPDIYDWIPDGENLERRVLARLELAELITNVQNGEIRLSQNQQKALEALIHHEGDLSDKELGDLLEMNENAAKQLRLRLRRNLKGWSEKTRRLD